MYRIGVDVGGTNTDSALLDISQLSSPSRGVLASSKTPTTTDITSGIIRAVSNVLKKSNLKKNDVLSVTIGTTHFINAVVEADERRLSKVAVVRLCGTSTRQIQPFSDYPSRLRAILEGPVYYLDGGLEIDGREIAPLSRTQIEDTVDELSSSGFDAIALVGVFSPLDLEGIHEETCKKIMLERNPALRIVCSHTIGGVGLLERENATILNASILAVARKTVNGFKRAIRKLELSCPLYLTQNDGALISADVAEQLPIKTFSSGPTNSMTGAAFLAGVDKQVVAGSDVAAEQILVVDIGGTTTDICALLPSGFPRQAPNFVEVGGVRTAFSMPNVLSIGLGGGSRVNLLPDGEVKVGPESVGHELTSEALVFGGDVLTASDIVVATGKAVMGDIEMVCSLEEEVIDGARKSITRLLQRAIEEMRVSSAAVTVLLVGGGSIVYIDELDGVAKCIVPPHHDSANAVGAAIAKVSGEIDIIEILDGRDETAVVKAAGEAAIAAAIQKGAEPSDVRIVEIEKLPLQYVTNKATRIRIKAIGRLDSKALQSPDAYEMDDPEKDSQYDEGDKKTPSPLSHTVSTKPSLEINIPSYRPNVRAGIWYLSEVDLEFIACGTGVLGIGGGGSSYLAYLVALDTLRNGGREKMRVIAPEALSDSEFVCFGAWYGAPSVSSERIAAGTEIPAAIDALNKVMGVTDFQALLSDEIGGGNGLATFPTSVYYDRPTIDGDMMGRAYPSMEHGTPYVYGHPIAPCAMADAKGNVSIVMSAESNAKIEKMLRATCIELGLKTSIVGRPLPGSAIKQYAIPNTISQAWYLGRAVHSARRTKSSFVEAIFNVMPGQQLFVGKIIDVKRDVSKGYTMGRCLLAPLSEDENNGTTTIDAEKRHVVIPFQNEYLYAAYTDERGVHDGEVICTVPDLISILGEDGEAIGSQDLRYGLRVVVIGMPAHPLWTGDARGLKVGGPEYFGLNMEWTSIGKYEKPRSVIAEFG